MQVSFADFTLTFALSKTIMIKGIGTKLIGSYGFVFSLCFCRTPTVGVYVCFFFPQLATSQKGLNICVRVW